MSTDAAAAVPAAHRRFRRVLPLVVGAWALGVAFGFWSLLLKDRHPLDPDVVARYFDAARVAPEAEAWLRAQAPLGATAATVVHVAAPGCRCEGAAERHVATIAAAYRGRGVRFLRATPAFAAAGPAALVFDRGGRLVYFGPYSDEADCGTSGGFVERTLDNLSAARAAAVPKPLAIGCFCLPPAATAS
ncbi:MAG: hypothetical protein JSR73_19050 [Proteobacteria bacterium]|nr:hypothetical protein [Pseudomonadota bacterium]